MIFAARTQTQTQRLAACQLKGMPAKGHGAPCSRSASSSCAPGILQELSCGLMLTMQEPSPQQMTTTTEESVSLSWTATRALIAVGSLRYPSAVDQCHQMPAMCVAAFLQDCVNIVCTANCHHEGGDIYHAHCVKRFIGSGAKGTTGK